MLNQTNQYPNAGLVKRLLATIYDLFPLFGVAFLYTAIVMTIAAGLGLEQEHLTTEVVGENLVMRSDAEFTPALQGPIFQLGLVACLIGFYCFFWLRSGQTLGMQAWRLKLVRQDGRPLTLGTCLLRCIAGFFGLLLFGIGYWWILFDRKNLALHDKVTGTCVVQLPKSANK